MLLHTRLGKGVEDGYVLISRADARAVQGESEAQKITSYPMFDWLRFVLASTVVLHHADFRIAPFLTGNVAVQVFFALSGWLIGGILLRTSAGELPRFFFNRATRIWIPYGLAIILLYGVAAAREGVGFYWIKYLILDVTFTHQLFTFFPAARAEMPLDGSGNQFWSIAVEEQFYLIAPLIILFAPKGRSLLVWAPVAAVTTGLGWNAAPISLGVCAAIVESTTAFSAKKWTQLVALAVAAFCAVIMASGTLHVVVPVFALAVVLAASRPGPRSSVALIAGGLSYPLYLNHWIGVFAINFIGNRIVHLNYSVFVVAQYILNIAVAFGLYWVIDRQIQLSRHHWYSPRLGRGLAISAYALVATGLVLGPLMHIYGPRG